MSKLKVWFTTAESLGYVVDEVRKHCTITEPKLSVPIHVKEGMHYMELDVELTIEQLEKAFEAKGYLEQAIVGINNAKGSFLSNDDINGCYIAGTFHLEFRNNKLTSEHGFGNAALEWHKND